MDDIFSTRHPDQNLFDFLVHLRSVGFSIGTDHFVRCQVLLHQLRHEDRLPDRPEALARLISPVVCSSPSDQTIFRNEFREWFGASADWYRPSGGYARSDGTGTAQDIEPKRSRWWRIGEIAAIATSFPAVMAVVLSSSGTIVEKTSATLGYAITDAAPNPLLAVLQESLNLERLFPALLPWAVFALVLLARRLSLIILGRTIAPANPTTGYLPLTWAESTIFPLGHVRRHLQMFRQMDDRPSPDIDVVRTLERYLRTAGFATFAFRKRRQRPEYLVLVDRVAADDHQSVLADILCARLRAEQVAFERYDYRGAPLLCVPHGMQRRERAVSLDELINRHAGFRLILMADGLSFRHPLTGRLHDWLTRLDYWTTRVLLTPRAPSSWGAIEEEVQDLGYVVVPADSGGLEALASFLRGGEPVLPNAASRKEAGAPLPSLLRLAPDRWVQSAPPDGEEAARLCKQLEAYLGARTFRWMCCCAVCPVLSPEITLNLGARLTFDGGGALLSEDGMMRLARLPWFRRGFMPNWLRIELLHLLPPTVDAQVRDALAGVLLTEHARDGMRSTLAIMNASSDRLRRLTLRLIGRNPSLAGYNDRIFLSFMRGWRPSPLELGFSRRVARKIEGIDRLDSFMVAGLVLTSLTSITALALYPTIPLLEEWLAEFSRFMAGLPALVWGLSGGIGLCLSVPVLYSWLARTDVALGVSKVPPSLSPKMSSVMAGASLAMIALNMALWLTGPPSLPSVSLDLVRYALVLSLISTMLHFLVAPVPPQAAAYRGAGLIAVLDLRGLHRIVLGLGISAMSLQTLYVWYLQIVWNMQGIGMFLEPDGSRQMFELPAHPLAAALAAAPWYGCVALAVLTVFRKRLDIPWPAILSIAMFAMLGRLFHAFIQAILAIGRDGTTFYDWTGIIIRGAEAGGLFFLVTWISALALARFRLISFAPVVPWIIVASLFIGGIIVAVEASMVFDWLDYRIALLAGAGLLAALLIARTARTSGIKSGIRLGRMRNDA